MGDEKHFKEAFAEKQQKLIAFLKDTRLVRANLRYSAGRGKLLAGGIAYSALFSIAGILVIIFTFISFRIGNDAQWFELLAEKTNELLPGIVRTERNPDGLLSLDVLIVRNPFNLVTLISFVIALCSALSLIGGLRVAIWSMFGIARLPISFISQKLRDFCAFTVLAAGVVFAAAISAMAAFFAEPIFEILHFPSKWASLSMFFISAVLGVGIDTLVFAFIFAVLAGVKTPQKDLWFGCVVAALLSTGVRILGTTAVSSVAHNRLLAPFAAIATLLLWVNLFARITLKAAAFIANPPQTLIPDDTHFPQAQSSPNYVTKSDPDTLAWDYDPITGVILPDSGEKTGPVA